MPAATVRQVHFAPTAYVCRLPREDERFVMKQYADHADLCTGCANPYDTYILHGHLCTAGTTYAKDVAQYIYCKSGKAFSTIDRDEDDSRVQIEIPRSCEVIVDLLRAVEAGLRFPKHKPVIEPVQTRKVALDQPVHRKSAPHYYEIVERSRRSSSYPPPSQSKQKLFVQGRGSLYRKDATNRWRREREDEHDVEPIIITVSPRRVKQYHR